MLGELCAHYPDDPSLRSALGQCQIETKAYDSALSLCSECLQTFPEQSDQWWQFRIAVITAYLSDGRCGDAIKTIDGFKESSPDLGGERVKAELLKLRSEAEKKRKEKEAKEK